MSTVELASALIAKASVTPRDEGCQELIGRRLEAIGFRLERMRFGEVENLWARRGAEGPLFCFAGHTDVVPTGPLDKWSSNPFEPVIRDGMLYGRGAADMKGSLAAMVTAVERFVAAHPDHSGSIAFLLTADEEGPSIDGTRRVIEALEARNEKITWCVVGEPSSEKRLGDLARNGRRGSMTGYLTVRGKQGHVAYPHLAENPIHKVAPALAELAATEWDRGNEYFPPTGFQIVEVQAGTGANNVIPGELRVMFNFRFSTEQTPESLQERVREILARHNVTSVDLEWKVHGLPFLTQTGRLIPAVQAAVRDEMGFEPVLSTGGGTSDGRFIAPTGAEVIELGPLNATIHQIDECVSVADLERLSRMYERVLGALLRAG